MKMKSKIRFIIVACFIAGIAVTGFNMAQNNQSTGVSLADIAVMARADGEHNPCPGWNGEPYCLWHDYFQVCVELAQCRPMCLGGC